jgi:hypothetical protein
VSAPGEVKVTATVTAGDDGPARTVSLRLVPKPKDPPPDGEEPKEDTKPNRWLVRADSETHTVEVGRWAVRPLVEVDADAIVEAPAEAPSEVPEDPEPTTP